MTYPPEIRLKDIKARKGHICQGGHWDIREGPVCGCGVALEGVPDFLSSPADSSPHGASEPPHAEDASDHPHLVADLVSDEDELEQRGREIIARHGAPDMAPSIPIIDPTMPYGPAEVERAILDANRRLERGLEHEAALIVAADSLKVEHALAFARAVRDSDGGAADLRKADAVLACEAELRAYMDACAARDAMKSVTHTLRATLSGLQSVGRSVGVSYQTTSGRGR